MNYYVRFSSWAGYTWHRVTMLKKCPKRSKVRFEEPAFGRQVGYVQHVPNFSLHFGERPQVR